MAYKKHTKTFKDKESRNLIKPLMKRMGFSKIYDPEFYTGKKGDLFCYDPERKEWISVEVEQMGKDKTYVDKMIRFANGERPWGGWKNGFTLLPRKFEDDPNHEEVIEALKEELGIDDLEDMEWEIYVRITPDKKGAFVAWRGDVKGEFTGEVSTENYESFEETRKTVPWSEVDHYYFDDIDSDAA